MVSFGGEVTGGSNGAAGLEMMSTSVCVEKDGRSAVDLMYSYVKHSSVASCDPPELLRLAVEPGVTVLTGEQEMAGWTKK